MSHRRSLGEVWNEEFLPMRAKLLEVAAALDRLDRAAGDIDENPRHAQIQAAIQVLLLPETNRAEQLQLIFSRKYEEHWRQQFGLNKSDSDARR